MRTQANLPKKPSHENGLKTKPEQILHCDLVRSSVGNSSDVLLTNFKEPVRLLQCQGYVSLQQRGASVTYYSVLANNTRLPLLEA